MNSEKYKKTCHIVTGFFDGEGHLSAGKTAADCFLSLAFESAFFGWAYVLCKRAYKRNACCCPGDTEFVEIHITAFSLKSKTIFPV